ncbi:MAG: beta-eliminating lyase-related protein, partial [Pseudohongiellaceae bacterium]
MPDFRSDTVTRPTAAMREVMVAAALGDDVFGDDPSVNQLEAHAAALLGFEAAVFAPSGTQTNLMGLLSHCERGEEAIVGQQWHTYRWEAGGMAVLGSIQPQPIENAPDGTLPLEAIVFAEEEGTTFGLGMLGSRGWVGTLDVKELAALKNSKGEDYWQAGKPHDADPVRLEASRLKPSDWLGFLELHIEQGVG